MSREDLEEPDDGLTLDERIHLEVEQDDIESIQATEEAEERLRDRDD